MKICNVFKSFSGLKALTVAFSKPDFVFPSFIFITLDAIVCWEMAIFNVCLEWLLTFFHMSVCGYRAKLRNFVFMDNTDITLDGFDPDALDNLDNAPAIDNGMQRPVGQRVDGHASLPGTSGRIRGRRPASVKPEEVKEPASATTGEALSDESRPANTANRVEPMDLSISWNWIRDGRLSKMLGTVVIMIALFFFIVTISFFQTGAADQSVVMAVENSGMPASGAPEVDNVGKIAGALLSYNFISRWLGLGAFAIIYWLTAIGLALMRVHRFNIFSVTAKSLMSSIALSVIAGYVSMHFVSTFHWGGNHGLYVNELAYEYSGEIGCLILSAGLLAIIVFVFMQDLLRGGKACIRAYRNLRESVVVENRRRREREDAARAVADQVKEDQNMPASTPVSAPVTETGPEEDNVVRPEEDLHAVATVSSVAGSSALSDTGHHTAFQSEKLTDIPVADDVAVASDDVNVTSDEDMDVEGSEPLKPLSGPIPEPEVVVRMAPEVVESREVNTMPYDPTAELSHYHYPSLDLLHERETRSNTIDVDEQEENKQRLVATLASFGIGVTHIEAIIGPTVTLYEIVPSEGVRIARIKVLENDLARAISAIGTRIIAPIPGRDTVGIEVPNKDPQIVPIRTILASEAYQNCKMQLPMAMGVTIDNTVYLADLCKMPHLLVAGATGMGKSVGLNTIIASLLYKKHPAELKFVLVDPKMVEFSLYRRLEKHYLAKLPDQDDAIITDPMQVIPTLNSLCLEMDQRYMLLKDAYVRNITEYNAKFTERRLNPEKGHRFLPYIVVVVDEFADLIMTAGKEVEQPIARIAQKARAVGIHLILATQRPSTNVITGIIKANFPGRIAFRVFQMVDSRTILDRPGANQLIGRGDMLFSRDGVIDRVQCAFIDTDEVDAICEAISSQQGYSGAYELPEVQADGSAPGSGGGTVTDMDPFFADAGRYVIGSGLGSTSAIQRHFTIGYPRAGKIMDQLEQAGVVGPVVGSKPRAVLMDEYSFEQYLDSLSNK